MTRSWADLSLEVVSAYKSRRQGPSRMWGAVLADTATRIHFELLSTTIPSSDASPAPRRASIVGPFL